MGGICFAIYEPNAFAVRIIYAHTHFLCIAPVYNGLTESIRVLFSISAYICKMQIHFARTTRTRCGVISDNLYFNVQFCGDREMDTGHHEDRHPITAPSNSRLTANPHHTRVPVQPFRPPSTGRSYAAGVWSAAHTHTRTRNIVCGSGYRIKQDASHIIEAKCNVFRLRTAKWCREYRKLL